MSEAYWYPDDKQWLKARKEAWKPVKKTLDLITNIHREPKKKYHKYHQELFINGTVNPAVIETTSAQNIKETYQYHGDNAFEWALPLFQLWYHPEPLEVDWNALFYPYLKLGMVEHLRTLLFTNYYTAGAQWHRPMFSAESGMMGGRESLLMKLICPGFDFKKPIIDFDDPRRAEKSGECMSPYHLEQRLRSHSLIEIYQDARFIPYAPGQYLWDHFSYALEHYPDPIFLEEAGASHELKKNRFLELIAIILDFENRTDSSRNRPSTIALVEDVIAKYEQKTFSDAMLKLWEEAKLNIKTLRESYSSYINFDETNLAERGFPVEVQRERISQWKQTA